MNKSGDRPRCCVHKGWLEEGTPHLVFDATTGGGKAYRAVVCGDCAGAIFTLVARKLEEDGIPPETFGLLKKEGGPVEEIPLLVNPSTGKPFKAN